MASFVFLSFGLVYETKPCYVAQAGFEDMIYSASASQVLGLEAYTIHQTWLA